MTGREPLLIAQLLDYYPDVYDAYRKLVVVRLRGDSPSPGGFLGTRERTRAQRLARIRGSVRK